MWENLYGDSFRNVILSFLNFNSVLFFGGGGGGGGGGQGGIKRW